MENEHIIDFIRLLKANYSTDVMYLERLIESEIQKPIVIFIENQSIQMYHKVTDRAMGEYKPSDNFKELCNAFIELSKPTLKLYKIEKIKEIFSKYRVNKKIF